MDMRNTFGNGLVSFVLTSLLVTIATKLGD